MKDFRVILVPEDSRSPRQVRISGKTFITALVLLGLFLMFNFALLGWNIWHFSDFLKLSSLENERECMQRELKNLYVMTDSLSDEIKTLSSMNEMLYASAGIEKPEYGYAVGGRQLVDFDDNESVSGANFMYRIDSLRFVARQEIKFLTDVEKKFKQREKILRHTPSIKPMKGFFSSPFGKRLDPITGTWRMHEGVDICAPKGTPVYATADGRVKAAKWEHGFGKVVIIDHIWYETRYAHLDEFLVKPGQRVKRGDVIGKCGRTGRATGVHLHYEVRVGGKPVNPMDYILPRNICVD